jgi:hypothetical protein
MVSFHDMQTILMASRKKEAGTLRELSTLRRSS